MASGKFKITSSVKKEIEIARKKAGISDGDIQAPEPKPAEKNISWIEKEMMKLKTEIGNLKNKRRYLDPIIDKEESGKISKKIDETLASLMNLNTKKKKSSPEEIAKLRNLFIEAVCAEVEKRMKKLKWNVNKDNKLIGSGQGFWIKYGAIYFIHQLESREKGKLFNSSKEGCIEYGWHGKKNLEPPEGCRFDSAEFQKLVYDTYKDVMVNGTSIISHKTKEPIFSGFGKKVANLLGVEDKHIKPLTSLYSKLGEQQESRKEEEKWHSRDKKNNPNLK